jgi:hypothetical protein
MTNNFDLNRFNSFIESANNIISCDSNCQKNKRIEVLKNNLQTTETNLALALPQFELARKNYYTYISGENGYNEMIEEEFAEKANLFIEMFKDNFQTDISKIRKQIETYNGLFTNFRNVLDLYNKYKKENIELTKQLKEETNDILTNDRKTYYENQEIDGLNLIYYYFLWTIYLLIVFCFGIFSLIYPSQYNWKIRFFILIIFIVLPFISTIILGKFIQLLYWLFGIIPKNVYK